ncbi:hypothetical protein [Shimia aestuarii]|uniref:VPLPA-CTERM protein sorting domain-containing protein n=1 Tax=Shimia aestuarii TaxID=254406 RepID=A0A1I4IRC1_9RHOB|nr:hypothetical protein [Shimia aestuarii]SFL56391.1 VPLPA-CTERM protein sorting domain-containing protein [Shimia aestuarii]
MKKFSTALSVIALATLAAPVAQAKTIIDHFTSFQKVTADPDGVSPSYSEILDGSVIGGARDMRVTTDPSGDIINQGKTTLLSSDSVNTSRSELTFSNASGVTGTGLIVYDGVGGYDGVDIGSIATGGLGGIDLTKGGKDNAFFFGVTDFDLNGVLEFEMRVWDTEGGFSDYTETVTITLNPLLKFNEFSGDVNFEKVGAIAFALRSNQASFDGAIDLISVVPVPASALLLLGALGGLGGISASKRRRRKAA